MKSRPQHGLHIHATHNTQTDAFYLSHEFEAGGTSRLVCENKLHEQGEGGAVLYYSA
jgi:hypothetical protein